MNMKSSAIIHNDHEGSELCKKRKGPVDVTQNDKRISLLEDNNMNTRQDDLMKLREELLEVEKDRLRGDEGYTVKEVVYKMHATLHDTKTLND